MILNDEIEIIEVIAGELELLKIKVQILHDFQEVL